MFKCHICNRNYPTAKEAFFCESRCREFYRPGVADTTLYYAQFLRNPTTNEITVDANVWYRPGYSEDFTNAMRKGAYHLPDSVFNRGWVKEGRLQFVLNLLKDEWYLICKENLSHIKGRLEENPYLSIAKAERLEEAFYESCEKFHPLIKSLERIDDAYWSAFNDKRRVTVPINVPNRN